MARSVSPELDGSVSSARGDGFAAHCPVCRGPMIDAGRSGRIFWLECLLCGRSSGLQVTREAGYVSERLMITTAGIGTALVVIVPILHAVARMFGGLR